MEKSLIQELERGFFYLEENNRSVREFLFYKDQINVLIEALDEHDRYKWHDLEKDPSDLPEFVSATSGHEYSETVEVVSDENVYDTAIYVADRVDKYSPAHKKEYFLFGDDEILEGNTWDGAVSNAKIVAWRYVKPFKERK